MKGVRVIVAGATLATALSLHGAHAGPCETAFIHEPAFAGSPRVVEITVAGSNANVLLPPGYSSSMKRYPVLYLLRGFSMNEDSWLDFTDVDAFTAELADDQQAIVVMPALDWLGVWVDYNETRRYETLMLEGFIPYVDSHFRTMPDGRHRAAAGLSAGGIAAEILAARHPDLFAAAGGFSGTIDLSTPSGEVIGYGVDRIQWACSGAPESDAVADPVTDAVLYHDLNVIELAPNYAGVGVYASAGNGVPCDSEDIQDLLDPPSLAGTTWQNIEPFFRPGVRAFDSALSDAGIPHHTVLRPCGLHSWRYWEQDLHAFWPIMSAAFGAPPPETFSHRRAVASFSVWGWTFTADPLRAPEFLEADGASASGVTLTGSGLTTVTTAPFFAPGEIIALSGAQEPASTSDGSGRITFHVDLGPAHTIQQYTPQAYAMEAFGDYWTTRRVQFTNGG